MNKVWPFAVEFSYLAVESVIVKSLHMPKSDKLSYASIVKVSLLSHKSHLVINEPNK